MDLVPRNLASLFQVMFSKDHKIFKTTSRFLKIYLTLKPNQIKGYSWSQWNKDSNAFPFVFLGQHTSEMKDPVSFYVLTHTVPLPWRQPHNIQNCWGCAAKSTDGLGSKKQRFCVFVLCPPEWQLLRQISKSSTLPVTHVFLSLAPLSRIANASCSGHGGHA